MASLVLVGMMGSGKTTVGRIIAARLEVPFKDTDKLIQHKLGRAVHQLFLHYGEDAFRQHESRVLQDLPDEDCVISTGGGTVLREENWKELRRLGTTVFLDVDVEVLKSRLKVARKVRPLLEVPGWEDRVEQILEERRPMYEQADIVVRLIGQEAPEVADLVQQALQS
ncbi:MAG: shikimate kinase [Fimbriimonadaceae bacterium]